MPFSCRINISRAQRNAGYTKTDKNEGGCGFMLDFGKDFYQNLFESLDNNSVLMRVGDNGSYVPVWCSHEYAEMMEGTREECIQCESEESNDSIINNDEPRDNHKIIDLKINLDVG